MACNRNVSENGKKRQITPFGKVAIIKSLVISKIVNLLLNLPDPEENFLQELEKELFNFLWGDKPSKISKFTVKKEYSEGGIRMINVRNFITALKTSWIRKIKLNEKTCTISEDAAPGISKIQNFGKIYSQQLLESITNPFWKDVIKHYIKLSKKCNPTKVEEFFADHIFYNMNIKRDNNYIFIKEFSDNNIHLINHLCKDDGTFLSFNEFKNNNNWCTINFLTYNGILNSIKDYMRSMNINTQSPNKFVNKLSFVISKGNKFVQNYLNSDNWIPTAMKKWNNYFENLDWSKIFSNIYTTTIDTQLRWFQFRLLHRIIPTQKYLYITKISDDPVCNLCSEEEQDICHLFFECNVSLKFWESLQKLLKEQCIHCQNIKLDKELIIFGYKKNFISDKIFNFIILFAKFFLYKCKLSNSFPTINRFKILLKNRYSLEKYTAFMQNKEDIFSENWRLYQNLIA